MKRFSLFVLLAASASLTVFTSCSKDSATVTSESGSNAAASRAGRSAYAASSADRIDVILKDLSTANYSLSFENTNEAAGITRTQYGADNYLAFTDPQILKCPDFITKRYRAVPLWRIPKLIKPTCPDMVIDIAKLRELQKHLVQSDYKTFGALKEYGLSSGGGFLADDKFTSQFARMQYDKIDDATQDLNPASFLLLNQPGVTTGGFTRNFYGHADLNNIVLKRYRKSLIDIFKPTLKGCFDPKILAIIRERLMKIDPSVHKNLAVVPFAENNNIAMLQAQY